MKLRFFLLIISSIFLFSALPARAFEISPIKMLVTADSDTTRTVVLKIKNSASADVSYMLSVLGMKQDNAGLPVFERGISAAEAWVYPETNKITIRAGETKSANFIIKVPASSSPGSYYLGIAAEPEVARSQGGLNARLVSLLTLQVSGSATESVVVEIWEKASDSTKDMWKFNLQVHNTGSVEVPMQATVALKNYRGDDIFSQPISVGNKLLAGSKRALVSQLNIKDRLQLPGLYQVQIKIRYGKTGQEVSAISSIWYFPVWSKIAGAIVAGILIILIGLRFRKRV